MTASIPLTQVVPPDQGRPPTTPLVSLRDVCVDRGGRPIINKVTADLARGRITALIGLNGSGKSTLLRAVVGEFPYRGEILFRCGHDHTHPRPDHVGYVPQRLTIDPRLPLTVRDLMGLALKRLPLFFGLGRALNQKIAVLLDQVGVGDLIDVPVDGLSGGQLQRVLLSLALEPQPELLLLDEPASGIDFKSQQSFYDLISDINRRTGVTILLVSHDLTVVSRFADHVLCLRDGVIHCQGHPQQILNPHTLADIFGAEMGLFAHRHD
ncbi:metal ABC transporter ATP-binding protein [Fimbriiglobus ruber]|uniref:Zinc ABC transporter, ATP-binding protein ZnuC n=1 Tax=Fimbriiglobus ruber TaxID=1908690 RepID=A0A225E2W0_9BACT|nr:metal ABC transporter ATP-binding protein [Fimbriiglobus ruber]OWK44416.1 Zinc ABC transporter, ATP-binding protein ZnuC [Fimbriiglobus ruber]